MGKKGKGRRNVAELAAAELARPGASEVTNDRSLQVCAACGIQAEAKLRKCGRCNLAAC